MQHAKLLCPWGRTSRIYIYGGMRDRSMQSGTELAREIQLTDWSTRGNLSNRSSGVQIPRDICTRFGRYLYSAKCSWIIREHIAEADPDLELRGGGGRGGLDLLALSAIFPSVVSSLLPKIRGPEHPGPLP